MPSEKHHKQETGSQGCDWSLASMAAEGAVAEAKLFGKWTFDDVEVREALPTWAMGLLVARTSFDVDCI